MSSLNIYQPSYTSSHALIIGIDKYNYTSPLAYAVNDATAVARSLVENLGFPIENVKLLTDQTATRTAIMDEYLAFSDQDRINADDRVFVFFAGHGHTTRGRRGETGFLVPVDGEVSRLGSLITWSELLGASDLIPAKHVFFLMDACYGGLALTRRVIPPGSMRLLEDMLQRFSRQVLTAGKGNETVSDGGGSRAGHSIFTSHVLDALEGAASATEGVITANGLMAYVYEKVGSDPRSSQTPHYGFLEGDGDFIFAPIISPSDSKTSELPTLIQTPSFVEPEAPSAAPETATEQLKRLIADPADRIRLDDFVTSHLRRAVQELGLDKFPTQGSYSNEEFVVRIKSYEEILSTIESAVILLSRWGRTDQLSLIDKIFSRIAETNQSQAGLVRWIELGWYPLFLLMYTGGIAALSEGRFDALRKCLLSPVPGRPGYGENYQPVLLRLIKGSTTIHDCFKSLPDFQRRYTPRSDYLYQTLQPILEDHLFLGQSYDELFDQFEIILALTYADLTSGKTPESVWGPPGRFAWKGRLGPEDDPFERLVSQASKQGKQWGPIVAGLFEGDPSRFSTIADKYRLLKKDFGYF